MAPKQDNMDIDDIKLRPEIDIFDSPLKFIPQTHMGRLQERICMSGMVEILAKGEGNCQFYSLAKLIYKDENYHKLVRKDICEELERSPSTYMLFSASHRGKILTKEEYHKFAAGMKEDGTWGNFITLSAAANIYQARINIVTSFWEPIIKQITPIYKLYRRDLYLSYHYENPKEAHYNPMFRPNELPTVPSHELCPSHPNFKWKKKKKTPHVADDVYTIEVNHALEVTGDDLLTLFSQYGNVVSANVLLDDDGISMEQSIVKMRNSVEFVRALLHLNGQIFKGEPMVVEAAKKDVNPHLANQLEDLFG